MRILLWICNKSYRNYWISNPLIEINGDKATAECYVWAYHVHEKDGVDKEVF